MNSSDLIALLQRIEEERGVVEVRAYDYAEISPDAVATGEFHRDGQGDTYLLLRP
ncbi:hypothetical protein PV341_07810 [Streptomyces sp. PA03-1a]|nr:hypothetical protein [Streptomyces sp. PA03-1a]